ncbi:UNVERIFIED_CONTAM: hypothetical protein RMT77_016828 [Armadillidium vulgare]
MKFNSLFSFTFVILVFLSIICLVKSAPNCRSTTAPVATNCRYGEVKDWCNRTACGKGPGQKCGGRWQMYGACGSGMYCNCGKCTGCAHHTMECHTGKLC